MPYQTNGTDTIDQRPRVLVVDDDPILREVMCEQLSAIGCRCIAAENGETGRQIATSQALKLSVIDISMPEMDGFSLLGHIRQSPQCADLPVIVCTSHNDRESIDRAYKLGASSFITKPINWPQFGHHVQFVMRNGEIERALRAAQNEALTASRMKSGLFQVLGHELKTPLTALIGMTGLLESTLRGRVGETESEHLEHIIEGSQRLNSIIGDVLLLSRALGGRDRKHMTVAAVEDILDDSLAGHRGSARARNIQLLPRPPEKTFAVLCDPHLLGQALGKLVGNAVKFSPAGGTVEVLARRRADGCAVFTVRDQGPGLAQAKLQECLMPFVQDDMSYARPAEGLGLGLPIAKAIAEAHGGELLMQSVPGQGLSASVRLPAHLAVHDQASLSGVSNNLNLSVSIA